MLGPALLSLHLSWAVAGEGLCARACQSCLSDVRFRDDSGLSPPCRSRLGLSSADLCLGLYCGPEARHAALGELNATCGYLASPLHPFAVDFTADDLAHVRRISRNDLEIPLDEVVIPSADFFQAWLETLDADDYVRQRHSLYGAAVATFWGAVVGIGVTNKLLLALSRLCGSSCSWRTTRGVFGTRSAWFRRNIAVPATFGYRCAQNVWWATIPPRIQTLTIAAFALINIICSVHGYRIVPENLHFGSPSRQVLRYVSGRTGTIAFWNFPIIWLFGMRNNLAIWMTGWDFGTYNMFHRWVARMATVEAVVHSVGFTILIWQDGGWDRCSWWHTQWFWNAGQVATFMMCALIASSVYWIRRHHYEAFLILHVGLSMLVLLAMLGHVSIFRGQYDALFWAPVSIWALDRVMRISRIIAFNPRSWAVDGLAVYNKSANIIRLRVATAKMVYNVRPGTYYYLMVLDDARCWESHPFTVASTPSTRPSDAGERQPLLDLGESGSRVGDLCGEAAMQFFIRPYSGFTLRLRDLAVAGPVRVLVEGPYGHTWPLNRFGHVVFIAGGSGVATPLSYLPLLPGAKHGSGTVRLHWAVGQRAFADEVLATTPLGDGRLSVDVYVPPTAADGDAGAAMLPEGVVQLPQGPVEPPHSAVRLHVRRLDIPRAVEDATAGVGVGGSLAVVACGPARMADDTRHAVVAVLARAPCQIEYFEEGFQW